PHAPAHAPTHALQHARTQPRTHAHTHTRTHTHTHTHYSPLSSDLLGVCLMCSMAGERFVRSSCSVQLRCRLCHVYLLLKHCLSKIHAHKHTHSLSHTHTHTHMQKYTRIPQIGLKCGELAATRVGW